MTKVAFHRIYWKSHWQKKYARLYAAYAKSPGNYYSKSSAALIEALNVKNPQIVGDIGCGTGAFTSEFLKVHPECRIFAIDISKEIISYYRKNFQGLIDKKINAIKGNAEEINKYTGHLDAAFVSSAVWDMNVPVLLRNLSHITGRLAFNVPYAVLDKNKGFIAYIESKFSEVKGKKYRRLQHKEIGRWMKITGWKIDEIEYSFWLSRNNIKQFLAVLRYRYPFIFFPHLSYNKAIKIIDEVFKKIIRELPPKGIQENGIIFIGKR